MIELLASRRRVGVGVHANKKLIGRCLIFWGVVLFLLVLDFVVTVVVRRGPARCAPL